MQGVTLVTSTSTTRNSVIINQRLTLSRDALMSVQQCILPAQHCTDKGPSYRILFVSLSISPPRIAPDLSISSLIVHILIEKPQTQG